MLVDIAIASRGISHSSSFLYYAQPYSQFQAIAANRCTLVGGVYDGAIKAARSGFVEFRLATTTGSAERQSADRTTEVSGSMEMTSRRRTALLRQSR
ncbi:hypothetical protein [Sinorhizobium meliloti]|uniref:hypothetical protein n=1 Tax=Rhizobium meliloti TaxID=382 RepID=UPI0020907D94|nr:hypothetical protein [Sinorhizobium meliloti]MCO5966345.1 hypothetical protein [Sinorhizobium meliloti]